MGGKGDTAQEIMVAHFILQKIVGQFSSDEAPQVVSVINTNNVLDAKSQHANLPLESIDLSNSNLDDNNRHN